MLNHRINGYKIKGQPLTVIISFNLSPPLSHFFLLFLPPGTDYIPSVVGFVLAVSLLIGAMAALLITCICFGLRKLNTSTSSSRRHTTSSSSVSAPREKRSGRPRPIMPLPSPHVMQPPTHSARSSCSYHFPLSSSAITDTPHSNTITSPHPPTTVIHLGQLQALSLHLDSNSALYSHNHNTTRYTRSYSLPSIISCEAAPTRPHHHHQPAAAHMSTLITGDGNGGAVACSMGSSPARQQTCKTQMSAGTMTSTSMFPPTTVLQIYHHHNNYLRNVLPAAPSHPPAPLRLACPDLQHSTVRPQGLIREGEGLEATPATASITLNSKATPSFLIDGVADDGMADGQTLACDKAANAHHNSVPLSAISESITTGQSSITQSTTV